MTGGELGQGTVLVRALEVRRRSRRRSGGTLLREWRHRRRLSRPIGVWGSLAGLQAQVQVVHSSSHCIAETVAYWTRR